MDLSNIIAPLEPAKLLAHVCVGLWLINLTMHRHYDKIRRFKPETVMCQDIL